jgi:hypothetical protein
VNEISAPGGLLGVIVDFLRSVGFAVRFAPLPEMPGLPGIAAEGEEILVDPDALAGAGDLLHEAGHLAVMSPKRRREARGRFNSSMAEEMMAQAWSYAAALHLGIDPAFVFHEHGYGSHGGGWLADSFAKGGTPGVPGLCWLGLTSHKCGGHEIPGSVYPAMIAWINETENELW